MAYSSNVGFYAAQIAKYVKKLSKQLGSDAVDGIASAAQNVAGKTFIAANEGIKFFTQTVGLKGGAGIAIAVSAGGGIAFATLRNKEHPFYKDMEKLLKVFVNLHTTDGDLPIIKKKSNFNRLVAALTTDNEAIGNTALTQFMISSMIMKDNKVFGPTLSDEDREILRAMHVTYHNSLTTKGLEELVDSDAGFNPDIGTSVERVLQLLVIGETIESLFSLLSLVASAKTRPAYDARVIDFDNFRKKTIEEIRDAEFVGAPSLLKCLQELDVSKLNKKRLFDPALAAYYKVMSDFMRDGLDAIMSDASDFYANLNPDSNFEDLPPRLRRQILTSINSVLNDWLIHNNFSPSADEEEDS